MHFPLQVPRSQILPSMNQSVVALASADRGTVGVCLWDLFTHNIATQLNHSVDWAWWQTQMASMDVMHTNPIWICVCVRACVCVCGGGVHVWVWACLRACTHECACVLVCLCRYEKRVSDKWHARPATIVSHSEKKVTEQEEDRFISWAKSLSTWQEKKREAIYYVLKLYLFRDRNGDGSRLWEWQWVPGPVQCKKENKIWWH